MNKFFGLIICLLSAKNVVSSEEKVITPETYYRYVAEHYDDQGEAAMMFTLTEMHLALNRIALNPSLDRLEDELSPLDSAVIEEDPTFFDFLLRNGADPSHYWKR